MIDRDSGDIVWAFDDVRAAQGAMEPPEVETGAYLVFDRYGNEAELGVRGWDVTIESWSPTPVDDRLRRLLREYIANHNQPVDLHADLETLALVARRLAGEEERARTRPRFLVPLLRWFRNQRG